VRDTALQSEPGFLAHAAIARRGFKEVFFVIFTARCYASAVLAMGLCPSVRPSQVGVLSKRLNEFSWFLACELPPTRPTLC